MSANPRQWVVPDGIRWDAEVQKSFEECAPYHLRGARPVVEDRTITFDAPETERNDWDAIETLSSLVGKLARGMRDIRETIIEEHHSSREYQTLDPFDALVDERAIVESSPGRYIYSGIFLDALNRIDAHMRDYALAVGAREEVYPATVPTKLLQRSGYLKSFPQHAFFVSPARLDQRSIEHIQAGQILGSIAGETGEAELQPPAETLAPTVCYHCFNARADRSDQRAEVVTAINMCHRYEIANVRALERLMTFRMREIIYFGEPDAVADGLDRCFDWFLALLRDWDVSFQATTANDPFFGNSSDSKRFFQTVRTLKREVRLFIPKTGKWISVASFNNHTDSLVGAFNIGDANTGPLTSGCVGFGYERLIYGLMAALGRDATRWPWR